MAAALVGTQKAGVQSVGSQASIAIAFPGNVTAGNAIVVGGVSAGNTLTATSVTDSRSHAYTRDANAATANTQSSMYSVVNITGGACTVTLDPTGSDFVSVTIGEFSGLVTSSPVHASGTFANNAGATTIVTSNVVTTVTTLIVAVMTHGDGTISITPDASYADIFEDTDSADMPINGCFKVVAAGTYTGSWTLGASAANRSGVAVAYIEAAAPSAPFPPWPPRLALRRLLRM